MNLNSVSNDLLVRQLHDLGVQPGAVLLVHELGDDVLKKYKEKESQVIPDDQTR
jgi:hypothetical protein